MRIIHNFRTGMGVWEELGLHFPQSMLCSSCTGRAQHGDFSAYLSHRGSHAHGGPVAGKGADGKGGDEEDRRVVLVSLSRKGRIARQIEAQPQQDRRLSGRRPREREVLLIGVPEEIAGAIRKGRYCLNSLPAKGYRAG